MMILLSLLFLGVCQGSPRFFGDNWHDPAQLNGTDFGWMFNSTANSTDEAAGRGLNTCGCATVSNRIVGGGEVNPKYSLPYQAFVMANGYMCGGTIINKRYVLTAMHCLFGQGDKKHPVNKVKVMVGEHDICDGVNEGGQLLAVEKFIERNDWNLKNDIAILKLKSDIKFTSKVKPACFPQNNSKTYEGLEAVVSGWGSTQKFVVPDIPANFDRSVQPKLVEDRSISCALKTTKVKIISSKDEKCKLLSEEDSVTRMCGYKKDTDTCQGDSGGPMAVVEGGKYVVVGVVSYGRGCADTYPGVYVRVSNYLKWIQENTKDGAC